jgi:D-sedoheptulose 7-phosphate isomerase
MENKIEQIKKIFTESITLKQNILADEKILNVCQLVAEKVSEGFRADKKVLMCGNGGSAADAQHLAAEFSGRFYFDRDPLFAEALHVNTSYLTAVANDYSYDEIYARLIKAKGREGDILFGISTSGNSKNIIRAFEQAKKQRMTIVGMTGEGGGEMAKYCDFLIDIPSKDTPRIQECHITLGHIICQLVEEELFLNDKI